MPNKKGKGNKGKGPKRDVADAPFSNGGALGTKIVAWNQLMRLSDQMKLPALTQNIFNVVQSYYVPAFLTASSSGPVSASYVTTLAQFSDNLSALTGLFDQYRINCVELWVKPGLGVNAAAAGNSDLFTVLDFDDSGNITSVAQANGYSTCIQTEQGETQRRCYKPRIAYAAYGSGAFTSYANQQAGWIDCASTGVSHFGVKLLASTQTTSSGIQFWDLDVRAHISFRSTH